MTPAAAARRPSRQSAQTVRPIIVWTRLRVGPNARPQSGHVPVTKAVYEQRSLVVSDRSDAMKGRGLRSP